ncbi:3995_t:CDS:2 [Gigaspora rosea]|nr:3995_t:CDS:2 [Gigaspora rosea]
MPCHADTIVKANQIRQTCNEDSKLVTIRAVGVYPVESEDCELDMALFIPLDSEERDPNTQSIFETNEYYCVSGKIVLGNYNGNLRLKVSIKSFLVGVVQGAPKEINSDNAIFSILVNDYAGQIYNFTIKFVFPHHSSRFKHLMTSTRLVESVIFVVGQMEIIEKDLYVYASNISYVDISTVNKKKVVGSESNPRYTDFSKEKRKSVSDLNFKDVHSSKCVRVVDKNDDCFEYCDEGVNEVNKECIDEGDEYKGNTICNSSNSKCHSAGSDKGKEKVIQPVVHNTRKWSESSKIVKGNEKV